MGHRLRRHGGLSQLGVLSARFNSRRIALIFVMLFALPASKAAETSISFRKDLAPILQQKCVACHSPQKTKGGFQLHTFEALMKGGESKAPSVTPGNPSRSKIFELITTKDPEDRMPQNDDPLALAQIARIEQWIKQGAKFDGEDPALPLSALIPSPPLPDPPASYSRPVPVLALAFSPDGKELAAGGYHEITIWEPIGGKLLRRISKVAQRTHTLAYSPDGKLLAAASGSPGRLGEVKLFDPSSGMVVKTLATAADAMFALCLNTNGTRLAAGGADNAIRIFSLASGKQELVIEQHADWVMSLAFSPDGSHVASASRDKSARVFDSKTGELETSYFGHGDAVFAVAFSADGKQICSAGRDKKIHLWQPGDAKKNSEIGGFEGEVLRLVLEDNQLFSCSADKIVRHHRLTEKKPEIIGEYFGHRDFVYALSYHALTHRLASGSFDGEVRIWSSQEGKLLSAFTAAPGYHATKE